VSSKIQLDGSDVATGRIQIMDLDQINAKVMTATALIGPSGKPGMHLVNKSFQSPVRIESISGKSNNLYTLSVANKTSLSDYVKGDDAWLSDVGPGDEIAIEQVFETSIGDDDAGGDSQDATNADSSFPDSHPDTWDAASDSFVDSANASAADSHDAVPSGEAPSSSPPDGNSGCSCETSCRTSTTRNAIAFAALVALMAGLRRKRQTNGLEPRPPHSTASS
jgi:hypothetical protein